MSARWSKSASNPIEGAGVHTPDRENARLDSRRCRARSTAHVTGVGDRRAQFTLAWELNQHPTPGVPKSTVQFDLDSGRFYELYVELMTRP